MHKTSIVVGLLLLLGSVTSFADSQKSNSKQNTQQEKKTQSKKQESEKNIFDVLYLCEPYPACVVWPGGGGNDNSNTQKASADRNKLNSK
ncbi:hypothetical protein [Aliikangiella coralliicola]|uniref:Porin n=1 Tax=Aliikangiella coralliicola TaxID=2592383 RepID=A0A545U6D3_9GAMM|nr:hypothetical protein [Aliikangiella coralliicola]TQV85026.1 hypothetical protein FLL46_21795 [Aliikangiella coralliicola]